MKELFNNFNNINVATDELCAKFAELYILLCRENSKNNLTRITDENDYWIKHVYDSLLIAEVFPEITRNGAKIADLGCGAGFPSIVLAVAFPDIHITAIDSIGKKTAFVQKVAEEFNLNNLEVITGRGRELSAKESFQGRFDYVTARAVAEVKTIFRESRRMLKNDGKMILFKTPKTVDKELCEIRKLSKKSEFKWELTRRYSLPQEKGERVFAIGFKENIKISSV